MASEGPTVEELKAKIQELEAKNEEQARELVTLHAKIKEQGKDIARLYTLANDARVKSRLDKAGNVQARSLLQGSQRSLARTVHKRRALQQAVKVLQEALNKSVVAHGKALQAQFKACEQTGTPFVDKSA